MALGKDVVMLALRLKRREVAERERAWLDYERACESWAADGLAPARCPHGMNLWVDYDPICGPCEDGEPSMVDIYARSLREAKRRLATADTGMNLASELRKLGFDKAAAVLLDEVLDLVRVN